MKQHTLIHATGEDHPGIVAGITKVLARHNVGLLDIGQSVTHGFVSLSFLIDLSGIDFQHPVLTDLQSEAPKLGVSLSFKSILDTPFKPDFHRYVLSCVSVNPISPAFIEDTSTLLASLKINIERMENKAQTGLKALDVRASSDEAVDVQKIKFALMAVSNKHQVDMAFLEDNAFRFNKKLIVFDMDSTLIQAEVIDEMAAVHGIGSRVKEITERAMNGELNFDEALKERVSLLKGLNRQKMEDIFHKLPLTPGTESFIKTVKNLGFKTAIVSGGFKYFAESLRDKLGIDYAFANDLEFDGDILNGKIKGEIINAQKKASLLEFLAKKENLLLDQVVAVGDGANDLLMLSKAGLGIAFHAKEKVRQEARHQLSHGPMTSILFFLGIPYKEHIE